MDNKNNLKAVGDEITDADFLQELRSFKEEAIVANEPCPEGHRADPGSGRCLPIGPTDHTAFTRSVNDDQGDEWRGLVDKTNKTFANKEDASETALLNADDMEDRKSCPEGSTFSFVSGLCITLEDAEVENLDEFAMVTDTEYEEVEVSSGDGKGGHSEITQIDPDGRRDTVNFQCPSGQLFDFKLRQCIPLNKDTVMASEELTEEESQELARHLHGKVAMTSADPIHDHTHLATLDATGGGRTSIAGFGDEAHSHDVKGYIVKDYVSDGYTSQHFGHALPQEVYEFGHDDDVKVEPVPLMGSDETAAPIKSAQRRSLPDSAFGVPGKRKFPLDTCARVRNAMARFNQAKGLTAGEKASLRRKIMARATECDIEVKNFVKATTTDEFNQVVAELLDTRQRVTNMYNTESNDENQGPCPPGMLWDASNRRCSRMSGFVKAIKDNATSSDIVSKQPAGRRDTVNHACPPGQIFDYGNRKCIPMDTSANPGQPGDTTKAGVEESKRDLVPNPAGLPAKLPQDCPAGTIWDKKREDCVPLDSSKKTKSSDEDAAMPDFLKKIMDKKKGKKGKDGDKDKKDKSSDEDAAIPDFLKKILDKKKGKKGGKDDDKKKDKAQTTPNGNGKEGKDKNGCAPGQFWNPITKKCQTKKDSPIAQGSDEELAGREGLVEPPGRVKLPSDCPSGTIWDGARQTCTPLSTSDKNRPSGSTSPMNPKSVASMSTATLIQHLDAVIKEELAEARAERSKVPARDLPNAAFPPSLISDTKRSFMHHAHDVKDPYDNGTVDTARLRNALARFSGEKAQAGFSAPAVADGLEHLMFHARAIVSERLEKKE